MATERGQRLGEIVPDELYAPVGGEALACRLQRDIGEVEPHTEHPAAIDLEEGEHPPIAGSEVEDAPGVAGYLLEQDALSLLRAMRIGVGPG
jgi:hypothetical protein